MIKAEACPGQAQEVAGESEQCQREGLGKLCGAPKERKETCGHKGRTSILTEGIRSSMDDDGVGFPLA